MATKEEYEAAKAARKVARDKMIAEQKHADKKEAEFMTMCFDFVDRFITAVERIAEK
jgi:hypothetical protein